MFTRQGPERGQAEGVAMISSPNIISIALTRELPPLAIAAQKFANHQ